MKKFLSVLTLAIAVAPSLAHALSFEVTQCGKTLASYPESELKENEFAEWNVLDMTQALLARQGYKAELTEGNNYVSSIVKVDAATGKADASTRMGIVDVATTEGQTPKGTRSWGWSFSLDGGDPGVAPNLVTIPYGATDQHVKWTYGYIVLDEKNDTECVAELNEDGSQKTDKDGKVVRDCTFREGTLVDCPSAK